MSWSNWSDLPIIFDRWDYCPKCRISTKHSVVESQDEEAKTCSKCRTRTVTQYEGRNATGYNVKHKDPTRATDDSKRDADRKLGRPKKRR